MLPALQRKCALLPAVIIAVLAFAVGVCQSGGFLTRSNPQLYDRSNRSPFHDTGGLILIGSNGSKPNSITHGVDGDGAGPAATSLNPKPANFRSRKWQSSMSDERIATIIVNGGTSVGLSASMASNPDLEGQPDVVAALVEHIRKFGK